MEFDFEKDLGDVSAPQEQSAPPVMPADPVGSSGGYQPHGGSSYGGMGHNGSG